MAAVALAPAVLIAIAFPAVLDLALKIADPIIDPIAGAVANGIVSVYEAYEKTKPPTGPVSDCAYGTSCKDRLMKCPNFHKYSDCEKWVEDKHACDGSCKRYHREWIKGRGMSSMRDFDNPNWRAVAKKQIIVEQPVYGKLSIGLRWDINPDLWANRGTHAFVSMGEWRDLNLSAGIFGLNGELLYALYPDKPKYGVGTALTDAELSYDGGVIRHNGNDGPGGDEGRKKEGNFGFNEVLSIDFDNVKPNVGAIILSMIAQDVKVLPSLMNCELSLFPTPSASESNTSLAQPPMLTVKLDPKEELNLQPGYIFAKFVRVAGGWKFVPIRQNMGFTDSRPVIEQLLRSYAMESTSASVPVEEVEKLDLRVVSFTKDRVHAIPIKEVGFVYFDVFGKEMTPESNPFYCEYTTNGDVEITYRKGNKTLKTAFIYVDHGNTELPASDTCFVVGAGQEPILCGVGNLGASKQLVARITDLDTPRWQFNTYAMPLKGEKSAREQATEKAYGNRLVPDVSNPLQVLKDIWAADNRITGPFKHLTVSVKSGTNLAAKDLLTSDPFVVVKFDQQKFKTAVKKSTLAPVWNETFTFDIEDIRPQDLIVRFRCKDWNKIKSAVSMGTAEVNLMELLTKHKGRTEISLPLNKDFKHPKQSVSGSITVSVVFSA